MCRRILHTQNLGSVKFTFCVLVPGVGCHVADFEFCFIVRFWIVLDVSGRDVSSACLNGIEMYPWLLEPSVTGSQCDVNFHACGLQPLSLV